MRFFVVAALAAACTFPDKHPSDTDAGPDGFNAAPDTTVTGPSGAIATSTSDITFSSDDPGATFQCSTDASPFVVCTSPVTTDLLDGRHQFVVRAVDAGIVDPTPGVLDWTIDTVAPTITFDMTPPDPSGPGVGFRFTTSDGVVSCTLDGQPYAQCWNPVSLRETPGSHTFAVHAVDAAGNATDQPYTWNVDCPAPAPAGTIGWWHFDDVAGTQSLADAIATGPSAVLGNSTSDTMYDATPLATGRFGAALAYNGEEMVTIQTGEASNAFTFEAWVTSAATDGGGTIASNSAFRIETQSDGTNIAYVLTFYDDFGNGTPAPVVPSTPNLWHDLVVTVDGSIQRFYVDGALKASTSVLRAGPANLDLVIGGVSGTGFQGAVDEVLLADIAEEPTSIDARYCAP